ncbi:MULTISPECIES: hypothetical protein [unclassified Imperialibacter]|uniref:hypothetical protein n=1 Tax=unclassified Imperialibacter TaxID=2629706 RepID=UPI0012523B93|nr:MULTISPECIES: hypothetical protein [unclassified Imperialibacter]CAD5253676.1 hypothetical protein IMPERIA75_200006 [Imperialibacter sp. 75]CAD5262052.1 hypothetical protein IMPERIA89_290006 [Imperialibacter sp. 89]VVT35168.1 hypothetical protein IMPR6_80006 [Imperialibacter sp. EC-SDR9]
MHNDELDKLIGDRLSGFELDPDNSSFDKIVRGVANARRRMFYQYAAAASLALLLTVGAGYWWMQETPVSAVTGPEEVGLQESQIAGEKAKQVAGKGAEEASKEMKVEGETGQDEALDNVGKEVEGSIDGSSRSGAPITDRSDEKETSGGEETKEVARHVAVAIENEESNVAGGENSIGRERVNFSSAPAPKQWASSSLFPPTPGFRFILHVSPTNEGQPVVVKPERERRWAVYAEAMPFFSYNIFEVNTTDEILITNVQQVPGFSLERLGVRGEVGVEYAINRKIHIQTGVMMYSRNQEANLIVGKVDSVIVSKKADNYNLTPVYMSDTLNMSVDILNLGLLVGVQFRLNDGKIRQWVGVSAEMHKGLKRNITFDQLVSQERSAGYYSFANLFYRAEYPWKPRATFFLQPTFNYSLYMGERLATPVNVRPYGLGASLGIRVYL